MIITDRGIITEKFLALTFYQNLTKMIKYFFFQKVFLYRLVIFSSLSGGRHQRFSNKMLIILTDQIILFV